MSAIEKLLIFGDSWPQGSELQQNQKPFGELLANELSVPIRNQSRPSTSIPHLILQLRDAVDPNRTTRKFEIENSDAIFFLTSPDRDLIWEQNRDKELYLAPSYVDDYVVQWYTKFHTPQLSEFRVNSTLLALQKLCEIHHIRDHYIWGWNRIELWPEINRHRFWRSGNSTILDLFAENDKKIQFNGTLNDYCNNRENRFVYPNIGHPNQRGHKLIAEELKTWLTCT